MSTLLKRISFVFAIIFCQTLMARPEYAVRENSNCIECHVSTYGAGHRKLTGKSYGSKEMAEPLTNESDLYYADIRVLDYARAVHSNRDVRGGMGLMMAEAGVQVKLFEMNEEEKRSFDTYVVGSYDFGKFAPGTRSAYILATKGGDLGLINSFLVGRFVSPFGLMTDEHRTYTKMASASMYNRNFEMGMMLSGNFTDALHYDLGLTNGFTSGELGEKTRETIGGLANMRWLPESFPLLLGTSFKYIEVKDAELDQDLEIRSPYAISAYSVFDFTSLTSGSFPLSLQAEFVQAKYWNDTRVNSAIGTYFATGTAYKEGIKRSTSHSYLFLTKYDFSNQWQLSLKYDKLFLDKHHKADAHTLHGLGIRYQFNAIMNVQVRYDNGKVERADLHQVHSNYDSLYLVFRTWL
jgi:hypothetical protein